MDANTKSKAEKFQMLHRREGILVMPNAWDRGSARILASVGFDAIATTSAGTNYANGTTDFDYHVPRDAMLHDFGLIARETSLPCNGDIENGYGDDPEDVAETIRLSIDAGMAGGNIEDHTPWKDRPLYEFGLAVERMRAARAAIDATGVPYVLTGRTDCYLVGHENAFDESVRRLNAYREAGADVLYAPGISDKADIAALVRAVGGPINVVVGRRARALTIGELGEVGVKRVSVGGALFLATYGFLKEAADELHGRGTLGWMDKLLSRADLQAALRVS